MLPILLLNTTGKTQALLTANINVSYTEPRIGITTSLPVNHELLKSSNSALATGGREYYVCIVRLIDARTNQYPEKPNQHPK